MTKYIIKQNKDGFYLAYTKFLWWLDYKTGDSNLEKLKLRLIDWEHPETNEVIIEEFEAI
jgi:hypothetical protein